MKIQKWHKNKEISDRFKGVQSNATFFVFRFTRRSVLYVCYRFNKADVMCLQQHKTNEDIRLWIQLLNKSNSEQTRVFLKFNIGQHSFLSRWQDKQRDKAIHDVIPKLTQIHVRRNKKNTTRRTIRHVLWAWLFYRNKLSTTYQRYGMTDKIKMATTAHEENRLRFYTEGITSVFP